MAPFNQLRERLRPFRIGPLSIHWLRYLLPLVMIGLAMNLLLPQIANLQEAWQTVERMTWWLVGLAFTAEAASYGGSGYLMISLAAMLEERLTIGRAILIFLAGNSIGLVAGGLVGNSAASYRWAQASGLSRQPAGLCATLPILIINLSLALISIVGLLHLLLIHKLRSWHAISLALILVVMTALVVVGGWGAAHPKWLRRALKRVDKSWARLRKRPYDLEATKSKANQLANTWLVLRSGGWRGPALGAALSISFDMMTLYLLFLAAGYPISPGILFTGYGLPMLLGKVGYVPGGIGIVEAAMTAIYASLGVPGNISVVVILGYRLISFWIPTIIGFPTALYLQHAAQPSNPTSQE